MFSDEQTFRVYNPSSVWGKPLYFNFLTLTKGYTPETSVYFFEGICYFLVFFVMKLSLLHLSKFKCHHSIHHSLKRSAWGLALVINISLFLVGEQRRRENRNKTATNPGPVSRKSRGNFPGCLRRRRSKPSSASAGYNAGYFPGLESCFLIAVFTFKINVLVWKWYAMKVLLTKQLVLS